MRSTRNSKTVLVEGLPLKSTNRDLNDHFSKFGPLTGCTVMTNKETGQCRGFGFVTFLWDHHCKICADTHPHIIRGTKISLRILSNYSVKEFEQNLPTKTLLVSFVGKRLRKFEIMNYFSRFGAISVETGGSKESMAYFAYVMFENEQMCRNCALSADHFISGYRVLVWPAVRREVYKRAEQAERERVARDEKYKAEADQQLYNEISLNPQYAGPTSSNSFNQHFPIKPPFSSCLVPPPPPPPPLPHHSQLHSQVQPHLQQSHSDIYASSPMVNEMFLNGQQLQTQPSHTWVPLLPSTSLSSAGTPTDDSRSKTLHDDNLGSVMAGYSGNQTPEVMAQIYNGCSSQQPCTTRKSRNTWARLVDLPMNSTTSVNPYAPHYLYKM